MKKNLPITNKEVSLKPGSSIISTTDAKGMITYVNREFVDISGFSEQELIGQNHNIIRHPDMPAAAFEDLWKTVKAGKAWYGLVKNRCKNGDHYWVEAFVTPIHENGETIGYQSVRTAPARDKVEKAEAHYAKLNQTQGAKLRKPFRLSDVGIMKRLGISMLMIGLLPLAGDVLWSLDLVDSRVMVSMALLTPVLLAAMGVYIYHAMFKPMRALGGELEGIASGKLDRSITIPSGDEIGQLFTSVKMLQARFRTMVGQMSEVSVDLAGSAQLVSDSSAETFQMMLSQQQSTSNANSSMQHMRNAVHEVAGYTRDAVDVAGEANDAAIRGKGTISGLRGTIESLVGEVESSAQVILDLNAKSQDIRSILEVIRSIAEQTNLLALNAAIEAARAGEQGRGFAVVADEVRTLASRTADATEETNAVIEQLQQGIDSAVQVMKHGQQTAGEAAEKSSNALNSIDELSIAVVRMTAMNAQIAESAENQLNDADTITEDMATITTMAGQTLAVTQTNSEAGNRLTAVSGQLVDQFRQFGMVEDVQQQIENSRNRQQKEIGGSSSQDDDSILF